MKNPVKRPGVIYVVEWSDEWCVIEGACPWFLRSTHRTRRGAETEARRMRALARRFRNTSGRVTTRYHVHRRAPLD